ncbi:MAG: CAP domain-containing protein [Patescibacteria group bacterium]
MKRLTKKLIIPHEGNNFHPYLLRASGIFAFLLLIVGSFVTSTLYFKVLQKNNFLAAILPSILIDLANSDRTTLALNTLTVSPTLEQAAQMKADDMAQKSYFAHTSPEGLNPWYWFSKAGYSFAFAGENLAIKFDDSDTVNTAWMNSPSHRANILNEHFTEIGVATSRGVYEGQETIFVVQMFGNPSPKPATTTPQNLATTTEQHGATTTTALEEEIPKLALTTIVPTEPEPKIVPIGSSAVLGAKIDESFEAVQNTSVEIPRPTLSINEKPEVLPQASKIDHIVSSPSKLLGIFYLMLIFLLFITLLFVLHIDHKRRAHNILSIIILFLIIVISYYGYQTLMLSKIQILDSQVTDTQKA